MVWMDLLAIDRPVSRIAVISTTRAGCARERPEMSGRVAYLIGTRANTPVTSVEDLSGMLPVAIWTEGQGWEMIRSIKVWWVDSVKTSTMSLLPAGAEVHFSGPVVLGGV